MQNEHDHGHDKRSNPWKTGVIATGAALLTLTCAGIAVATLSDLGEEPADAVTASGTKAAPAASAPAPAPAAPQRSASEICAHHLSSARRDNERVVKDGVLGGAVGAGVGAAGGAIADGGDGAGKGAGIGAVVGAVAGAARGLIEEDRKVEGAEAAYRECLARNG